MSADKKAEGAAPAKGAFLMLAGKGAGPFSIPDIPNPRGTEGWTPGKPVALKDIGPRGITQAEARKYAKTGLLKLRGAE